MRYEVKFDGSTEWYICDTESQTPDHGEDDEIIALAFTEELAKHICDLLETNDPNKRGK